MATTMNRRAALRTLRGDVSTDRGQNMTDDRIAASPIDRAVDRLDDKELTIRRLLVERDEWKRKCEALRTQLAATRELLKTVADTWDQMPVALCSVYRYVSLSMGWRGAVRKVLDGKDGVV